VPSLVTQGLLSGPIVTYGLAGTSSGTSPDLLAAIVAYLRGNGPITALLTTGWGQGGYGAGVYGGSGSYQIYTDTADANTIPPYIIIFGYREHLPGETLDDETVPGSILCITSDLDSAMTLGSTFKTNFDTPAINPLATRTAPLTFIGGQEIGLMRNDSYPRRMTGFSKGGQYAWVEEIEYVVWVTPEQ